MIGSETKSVTESIGEGFKVTTSAVKDLANPTGASQPGYEIIGYCNVDNLPGFRLDPPRGKPMRFAICLFTKKDDEGFHLHKWEYLEPDQVDNAVQCMRKLRKLCMGIHSTSGEKRSHSVSACTEVSPMKKARTLQAVPTDAEL